MTIYVVEKDYYVLREYERMLDAVFPKAEVVLFTGTVSAWEAAQKEIPDVVLLSGNLVGSIALVRKLYTLPKFPAVHWVCEGSEVTPELLNQNLCKIFLKPVTEESLKKQLSTSDAR